MVTKRSKDDKQPKAAAPGAQPVRGKHAAHAAPVVSHAPSAAAPTSVSTSASKIPGAQRQTSKQPAPHQGQGQRIPQQKVAPNPPARANIAQGTASQSAAPKQSGVQQGKKPTPRTIGVQAQHSSQGQGQGQASSKTVKAQATHDSRASVQKQQSKQGQKKSKKQKQRRIPLPVKIVLSVVLVAALAAGAFLVWDYLFRYDDAADFQGQWKIEGSNASIVITEDEIRLTDSVSFTYELNTFEKTIKYEFANYEGEGMYVFSPERDVLTLTDVSTSPDEGDIQQSMSLLKVSNQAIGEPEVANNNTAENADTAGVDVVDGSETAQQAEENE